MALETRFECIECGATYPRWQGQCTQCTQWNTLTELVSEKQNKKSAKKDPQTKPQPLAHVQAETHAFFRTALSELNLVLGGGFVRGSVTLLGGEPGIGKSTLGLQMALDMSQKGHTVLYVAGEESIEQVHLRAQRLGPISENLLAYHQTNMVKICDTIEQLEPDLVILDSIQVVQHPDLSSIEGTVGQVRHCANSFISLIKQKGLIGVMIGHITKDGHLAGPKVLEHMVDVILYFEGQRQEKYRILRCFKNRYASTHEIGIFEMLESGLVPVTHPGDFFLENSQNLRSGSAISAIVEGSRAFLVEVQALVAPTLYGMPRRDVVGVNPHRANLLIATLEKNCGIPLGNKDIFLNSIGGMPIKEPALDLAIVLAILSSLSDTPLPKGLCAIGEIGLTGEVRPVSGITTRLNELNKMGFTRCFVPQNAKNFTSPDGMKVLPIAQINEAFSYLRQEVRS